MTGVFSTRTASDRFEIHDRYALPPPLGYSPPCYSTLADTTQAERRKTSSLLLASASQPPLRLILRAPIHVTPFSRPRDRRCRRLFNIFHPYDPVAFRLEPLLRGGDGSRVGRGGDGREVTPEEPVILPTWTGGLRVHYQVQRWWQDLWSR